MSELWKRLENFEKLTNSKKSRHTKNSKNQIRYTCKVAKRVLNGEGEYFK